MNKIKGFVWRFRFSFYMYMRCARFWDGGFIKNWMWCWNNSGAYMEDKGYYEECPIYVAQEEIYCWSD